MAIIWGAPAQNLKCDGMCGQTVAAVASLQNTGASDSSYAGYRWFLSSQWA